MTKWPKLVGDHFKNVFDSSPLEHHMWRKRKISEVLDASEKQKLSSELSVVFTPSEVCEAIEQLKCGKTMAEDRVSAEMFKALNFEAICELALAFSAQASGFLPASPSWEELKAVLLPKLARPQSTHDYRPITIIPTARKLFSKVWLSKVRDQLNGTLSEWNLGCRCGYQASEVVFSLRQIIEKCREWRKPVFVAKLDFRKAFDSLSHAAIETTLTQAGVDKHLVLAYVREILNIKISFSLNGLDSEWVNFRTGLLQGDPASPLLFTATLNRLLEPLFQRWQREKKGFKLNRKLISLFAWMDDLYIVSDLKDDLQTMIRQVCQVTRMAGLLLQPAKCHWSTNCPDDEHFTLTAAGRLIPRVSAKDSLNVLGTQISLSGDPNVEWAHRLSKTWKAYWANHQMLLNQNIAPLRRVRLWYSCVAPVFLWGMATLTCSDSMMRSADVSQRQMVAKILRQRRRPLEPWLEWFIRTRRFAGRFLKNFQFLKLSALANLRKLTWAGHLARLPPERCAVICWQWRNLAWWRKRQAFIAMGAHEFRHVGQFGYPRRWEAFLEKVQMWIRDRYHTHVEWYDVCQDRDLWNAVICEFLDIPENASCRGRLA